MNINNWYTLRILLQGITNNFSNLGGEKLLCNMVVRTPLFINHNLQFLRLQFENLHTLDEFISVLKSETMVCDNCKCDNIYSHLSTICYSIKNAMKS